jgi:hypothetical protein
VLALVAVVLVGSVLSYVALPGFRLGVGTRLVGTVKEARRNAGWGSYGSVRPVRVQASSSVAGHGAPLLIDLINTDYWATDTTRDPRPQIKITYAKATDLDYLLVTSGAGADFGRMARPKRIRLTYSDGSSEELVLKDDPRAFGYVVHGYSITAVTLQVLSVYPSTQNTWVGLSELEFFRLN